jgi:hypothetical protein
LRAVAVLLSPVGIFVAHAFALFDPFCSYRLPSCVSQSNGD